MALATSLNQHIHMHPQDNGIVHGSSTQKLRNGRDILGLDTGLNCLQLQPTMPYGSSCLSSSIFLTRLFTSKTEMFPNFCSLTILNLLIFRLKLFMVKAHHCSSCHHCHCWSNPASPFAIYKDKAYPTLSLGMNQIPPQCVDTAGDKSICTINGKSSITNTNLLT